MPNKKSLGPTTHYLAAIYGWITKQQQQCIINIEKCKELQAENDQLGKDLSAGRVQKLHADAAA